MYSEIVKERLWSGSIRCLQKPTLTELVDKGVVCVVSCMPIGQVGAFAIDAVTPKPKAHRLIVMWDDEVLEPERIDYAIDLNVPTLIHCNAGENRSTTMAACWLLKHTTMQTATGALDFVERARARDLRRAPRVYDEMRKNVERYAEWLTPPRTAEEIIAEAEEIVRTSSPTGWLHSSEPNLQNIPIRTELGTQIKEAFRQGNKVVCPECGREYTIDQATWAGWECEHPGCGGSLR